MPKVLSDAEVQDFRRRLLDVAERAFADQGVEGVSVRQLAQQLGCSAMTPYRYFRDKNEILAAVTAAALDRFSQALEDAFGLQGSVWERSAAVRKAYLRFAFENPRAYKLMFDLPHPAISDFPDLERAAQRAEQIMTAPMERLVTDGSLVGDPRLLGRIFWSAIHGAVSLQLAGKLGRSADFDEVLENMLRFIVAGASSTSSSTRSR
ncbi:TetR/AcrR family transcriptional regulator [Variovorax gossypii]|uniref:TetR/AcrR family transcriptional regulator n=1 Tax=Variovorax gossypii TaxID=1679495 RepID=A0A431TKV3_9BURK|nr:TetR/AcrR family transcriptional regulator [Variovorax gossypii]RTQ33779.1 TetR/AcrR family transcriptional regulator [Variovorax gossypii]